MTYEETLIKQNRDWRGEKIPCGIDRDIKIEGKRIRFITLSL